MPIKIQLELPDDVDKKVDHYKVEHELESKAEAIIQMLRELPFKVNIQGLEKVRK
jgi:hypothetical protein